MRQVTTDDVVRLYQAGVRAVVDATSDLDTSEWSRPACGDWDAADTSRHLVGVADWYHWCLNRAIDGVTDPPFEPSEFDERNEHGVTARQRLGGPDAVAEFVERADSYLDRATTRWDLAFGFPLGQTTVGHHLAIAAAEWHLHAWDLTRLDDRRHAPANSSALFIAVGAVMSDVTGGLRGRLMRIVAPVVSRRAPWNTMLRRSGRPTDLAK